MAKSKRASRVKTNRAALRAKVFGPVEDTRTERLSAKLLELASQPNAAQSERMQLDDAVDSNAKTADKADDDVHMSVDAETDGKRQKKTNKGRVQKRRARKAHNKVVFSTEKRKLPARKGKQPKALRFDAD